MPEERARNDYNQRVIARAAKKLKLEALQNSGRTVEIVPDIKYISDQRYTSTQCTFRCSCQTPSSLSPNSQNSLHSFESSNYYT